MSFWADLRQETEGSALLEFAITLPLLVVFIVGIYDFSGAYNQKQKIEHAAQAGAAVAAGQPTGDIDPGISNPESLQAVVDVVFNSLAAQGVLPLANQGGCKPPAAASGPAGLRWTYTISGCPDSLIVTVDRGVFAAGQPTVSTSVTVSFPYHWRFNSVIQLLIPGASYAATSDLQQTATVQNQM
jgi:TadE-like protein